MPAPLAAQPGHPAHGAQVLLLEHVFRADSADSIVLTLSRRIAYRAEVAGPGTPAFQPVRRPNRQAYLVPVAEGASDQLRQFSVYPLENGPHWLRLAGVPAGAAVLVRIYGDTALAPQLAAHAPPQVAEQVEPRLSGSSAGTATGPPWFGRLEAGALDPEDPFAVTLAYGGALGVTRGEHAFLLRLVRQSRDRNSGPDIDNARTFVMADWELSVRPGGRQAFIRLGAGWLFRHPFQSTWALDLGAGLKYRLNPGLLLEGWLVDQMARLPYQTVTVCAAPFPGLPSTCSLYAIRERLQQNVGLLIGLEYHL